MDESLLVLAFISANCGLKWLLSYTTKKSDHCPHDVFLENYFKDKKNSVEIVGYGSLMSPISAKGTFPSLRNFKTVRVYGYRRVFSVPGSIFFDHEIANYDEKQFAGLTAEKADGYSFLAAAFTIEENYDNFLRRENTYSFAEVPYEEVPNKAPGTGLMCISSTDDIYISRWGLERFNALYTSRGVYTIWGWGEDSGIQPCWVYLRHCVLSARQLSQEAYDSFLDETYLVDRSTTIRRYLEEHPEVMRALPPEGLMGRYSG